MEKRVNRLLAIILLAAIFVIGGVTVALHFRQLGYAALVSYTQYTDENAGLFDGVSARIKSFTTALNNNILGKDWFEKINAKMQLSLGKQVLSFGGTTMVRLKTGQLYDVQADVDVSGEIDKMARLRDQLGEKGIPMLFVYAHSELYEDGMLPGGVIDYNNKVADDIVSGLRARGIETLDSREIYRERGLKLDEAVFRTDQHWSILTAFTVFCESVKKLCAMNELKLNETAADPEQYNVDVRKNIHMGDVGARVGAMNVLPDDFQVITPKFDTVIHRKLLTSGGFEEREGAFEQSVMNAELLEGDAPSNRYDTYGHHTEVVYFDNPGAPEGRLLIVKDSFGTPVASFMSTAARHVCALDLRKGRATIDQYVESFKPDAVLIVHCQEMFRGKNYVFVE